MSAVISSGKSFSQHADYVFYVFNRSAFKFYKFFSLENTEEIFKITYKKTVHSFSFRTREESIRSIFPLTLAFF